MVARRQLVLLALASLAARPIQAEDQPILAGEGPNAEWVHRLQEFASGSSLLQKRYDDGALSEYAAVIDGEPITVSLERVSFRGPHFKVLVSGPDGREREVSPGPVRTRRGTVLEWPGSRFVGSDSPRGPMGVIYRTDGRTYPVAALRELLPDAPHGLSVIISPETLASAELPIASANAEPTAALEGPAGTLDRNVALSTGVPPECDPITPPLVDCTPDLHLVEIGIDTDYIFVSLTDGPSGEICETVAHIEFIINAVNAKYERDLSLRHLVGTVRLRLTAEETPYPYTNDTQQLLSIMRTEWADTITEENLAFVAYLAGRGHDTANATGGIRRVCTSPNGLLIVSDAASTQFGVPWDAVAGFSHNSALVWGAVYCFGVADACGESCRSTDCSIMYFRHVQQFRCYLESINGTTVFSDRSYFTQCAIDQISPSLARPCVFDSANLNETVDITVNGISVDDNEQVSLTPAPVIVGTRAEATVVYTNQSVCPVTVDLGLSEGRGVDWQLLDAPSGTVTIPAGGNLTVRVAAQSDWPSTFNATLTLQLAGPLKERTVRLRFAYNTTTPLGVAPGPFALTSPADGASIVQDADNCIDFRWGHAQYVDHYEVKLLRKYETVREVPAFQIVLSQIVRFSDNLEVPTCALPPADGSPLEYIWVVRAVNDYGDRIVSYHPYSYHFPNGFGLFEPYIPSLTITLPPGGSNCSPTGQVGCRSQFEERLFIIPYGDLNFDSCVDVNDEQILHHNLGQTNLVGYAEGDLDFDGDVDNTDANILTRIGIGCPCRTFSGCGRVEFVTQGGCYHFRADCGEIYAIENHFGFNIGTRIWVRGDVRTDNPFCFPAAPALAIPDNEIGKCFFARGTLVRSGDCLLLRDDIYGHLYELENLGTCVAGDTVMARGGLIAGTTPSCPTARDVIHGNTIICNSTLGNDAVDRK